jgi:hypothetical protein
VETIVNQDEQKRLRRHYQTIRAQQRAVDHNPKDFMVLKPTIDLIEQAVARLKADFPNLVPVFDFQDAHSHEEYFNIQPVRAYLATVMGVLEAEIATDEAPVTETRSFPFIRDAKVREIVERDYLEMQRAFVAQCWKSTIILAGGAMEAVLTDIILANEASAKAASSAPKKPDITKWDLADLINVAVELESVSSGVSKLSHPVREYRNLVHPGNEMRTGLTFDREEARIALEVLNILHRDLS